MLKTAVLSMIDSNFIPGYIAFVKSLLHHNPWFKYPIVFLDLGILESEKNLMRNYYDNIFFIEPKYENYKNICMDITVDALKNTYYKLDMFSMYEWDKIVFIDMDIIVLQDIKPLFEEEHDLAGCHGYSPNTDTLRSDINSGVIVLNKKYIDPPIYYSILKFTTCGFTMPDQKAINKYFRGRIHFMDKSYNVEKRILHSKKYKYKFDGSKGDAKMLHFVSQKPWDENPRDKNNQGFEPLEELWYKYYNMEV